MRRVPSHGWLPGRRFIVYAIACALPVAVLGLILAGTFRSAAHQSVVPRRLTMMRVPARAPQVGTAMAAEMRALRSTATTARRHEAQVTTAVQRDLVLGLGGLYLILFVITAWAHGRLRRESARYAHLASNDPLTGLPNRTSFTRVVGEALDRARETGPTAPPVAIALMDLDRFKHVNDTLGHRNGDAALCALAERLREEIGDEAFVARLGGDEFGLVVADGTRVASILQRVRAALDREVTVAGLSLHAPASIGYVLAPDDGRDVDTLLARADVAMYASKERRLGAVRYEANLDNYDAASLGLVAELRHAIADDQLVLHYQPQLQLGSDRVVAVEALVRWQHPVHGLLFPDRFLDLAEQTDDIELLTSWVLRRALRDIEALGVDGSRPSVAVNVSARSLGRGELADTVLAALAEQAITADRLIIEVTETAILGDPERAAGELERLARAGVRVSLDDFGRGQTSIGHFSALPLHELKIDRCFVGDMDADPTHAAIVRSLVELGHNLGLQVVAEGVENDAVRALLHDAGTDVLQGFLLSRPLPLADTVAWLGGRTATATEDICPADAGDAVPVDAGDAPLRA